MDGEIIGLMLKNIEANLARGLISQEEADAEVDALLSTSEEVEKTLDKLEEDIRVGLQR